MGIFVLTINCNIKEAELIIFFTFLEHLSNNGLVKHHYCNYDCYYNLMLDTADFSIKCLMVALQTLKHFLQMLMPNYF